MLETFIFSNSGAVLKQIYKPTFGNNIPFYEVEYSDSTIRNGLVKAYYFDGTLERHHHVVEDLYHGECKLWYPAGEIYEHAIYIHGEHIIDIDHQLTDKEKFLLHLQYGAFKWLD